MRLAALIPLVGCVLNFFLALFVLRIGFRQKPIRVYFFWGLAITVWNLGQFFLFTVHDKGSALFWARFLWFGVIFIPILLFHLSLLIGQVAVRAYIWGLYAFAGALALSNFTDFFIRDVRDLETSGWYAIAGPGLYVFNALFCLVFVTIVILLRRRKTLPALNRSRLDALIFAQSVLVFLGTNDLLPIIGIDYYPFTHYRVYPYGSSAAVLYGLIVAYSVLQRHLLDIHVQLSRMAAQLIRFLFLFFIGVALLLTATLIAPKEFTPVAVCSAIAALMISGVVVSVFFPRLFGGTGLETWERRILGDRFEYQDQVRSFIENMSWYRDVPSLFDALHDMLTITFRLRSYQIILRDETSRVFALFRSHPDEPVKQLPELRIPSPVFQFFEWGKAEYLSLSRSNPGAHNTLEQQACDQLGNFSAEFCFALSSQNEPFGLLLVGEKISGEPYTATDINLLVALVKSMSLIINQIRLKMQILQAEELDLLGRMSRGVAHDLNNLLTPISTILQLSSEGLPQEAMEDLLPVALRNVKAMRAYIRESLFFSENLRPDFQLGRLDVLVAQAAEVARNSRDKVVDIITETPGEILVEMDEVLIQRMIANLISNAIDASATDAKIRVELVRLIKTEASRDWLRVRIIDKGEGIRKEDLNRVFTPYFTTKNRGDETRGFGLGLAICRKIVNLHGGNLSIASQLKRGTTVQVDLPSRQIKQAASPVAA